MKTVSVALVLCLNVGVDPPDVVKISPCARLECWIGKVYISFLICCQCLSVYSLMMIKKLSITNMGVTCKRESKTI